MFNQKSIALRFDLLLFLQIVPFPHSHSWFITLHNLQDNFFPHRISHTLLRLMHTFILYLAHLFYYHDSFFEHLRSSSLICIYTNRIYHCFGYIFHFCPMFTIEARIRTISVTYTCFFCNCTPLISSEELREQTDSRSQTRDRI